MNDPGFERYRGTGERREPASGSAESFDSCSPWNHPRGYLASPGLRDAVNVALALRQPLLVTGEPGTGKTLLAWSIAWDLGLDAPLVFPTKTTSTARDLFYGYDMLRHFQEVQLQRARPVAEYLHYAALGKAIMLSNPAIEREERGERSPAAEAPLPAEFRGKEPRQSVVLLDEIDKAPRDLPNDILNEIEQLAFTVQETGYSYRAETGYRPIVVLTSNMERTLPDAFLRRCIFFHLPFPTAEELERIVVGRMALAHLPAGQPIDVRRAVTQFQRIRQLPLDKPPATAELLDWLRVLVAFGFDPDGSDAARQLAASYAAVAKTHEDRRQMDQLKGYGAGQADEHASA